MAEPKSQLAKATSTATGQNVNDSEVFSNVMRSMPADTANQLPTYRAGDSFVPYGQSFVANPKVFFSYLDTLAVKYGLVFIKNSLAQNSLSFFKRGIMPYGGKIESVVYDTIEPKLYRPDLIDGAEDPFATNFGTVLGDTYVFNHDIESSNTIVDTQDTMMFQNLTQFNNFVYGKISQLVNGVILDEYYHEKLVLSKAYADKMITDDKATDSKDLSKKILKWTKLLRYFNRDSNAKGINQATQISDICVILPVRYNVDMDVNYFSNVFNSELVQNVKVHYLEVDRFPDVWEYSTDHTVAQADFDSNFLSPREYKLGQVIKAGSIAKENATDAVLKVDGNKIGAVILDRDALQLWDALPLTLSTINNPRKRYVNIFANKKTQMMFVQALNAKVIYADYNSD